MSEYDLSECNQLTSFAARASNGSVCQNLPLKRHQTGWWRTVGGGLGANPWDVLVAKWCRLGRTASRRSVPAAGPATGGLATPNIIQAAANVAAVSR